jgi:hypothetical protein
MRTQLSPRFIMKSPSCLQLDSENQAYANAQQEQTGHYDPPSIEPEVIHNQGQGGSFRVVVGIHFSLSKSHFTVSPLTVAVKPSNVC